LSKILKEEVISTQNSLAVKKGAALFKNGRCEKVAKS